MSRITHRDEGILVVDEVLPARALRLLRDEVAAGDYRHVHAQGWDKAWRLWDGHPLRGESVYFDPDKRFGWKGAVYPTASAVDDLIDQVRAATTECPDIAGVEGVDWVALYLAPWIYPVGSALAQHRDGGRYSGSFAYFAHARWGTHWGGELLVSRPSPDLAGPIDWMSDEPDDPGPGLATCISPRPNRLVLLGPDRPHRIARVDSSAGTHVRTSIAGFFLRRPEV